MTHIQVPFGDLKRQHTALADEIAATMARVVASGWYILGPEVQAFEAQFAEFCSVRHCIGVGNGTEALQLAMTALGIGPGDEVITVANAAIYEAITAVAIGATPVFVDVDADSHTMDPSLIERAITPRTQAIIPVHLYGRMADMDAIMAVGAPPRIPGNGGCAQARGGPSWRRPDWSFWGRALPKFLPAQKPG
ncbi:MAG TPA: DegT/DnrJ/EryC1/StrS family aminotransferase, partial [Roseiflexaceae bacterium]|nr:DegT/DnrJ/EryC1/StrS family aminotransferase [Roseiflexaceae bacterium]